MTSTPSDTHPPVNKALIDTGDLVLIVIDIQDYFLKKYDATTSRSVVGRVVWLLNVARHLGVPIVAMAEDIASTGPLTQAVQDALPPDTPVHDKDFFGAAGNPTILATIEASGRRTAILVGMETDVCVAQTALGLIREGYQVAALEDAAATTRGDQEAGLARMREAGAAILNVKALYYEWLRSVAQMRALKNALPELEALRPDDLVL